jgi:hypothetical protein
VANTPIEAVYAALKTEYEGTYFVRFPYVFDEPGLPYIYMEQPDDPLLKGFLCDESGGIARITIGFLSADFPDYVDILETIITFCKTLPGAYAPMTINQVQPTSLVDLTGLEQGEQKVYRRQFDLMVSWSRST